MPITKKYESRTQSADSSKVTENLVFLIVYYKNI